MNLLYKNWAKIGAIAAPFILIILFFIPELEIGSLMWLFWLNLPIYLFHQFEEYIFPGGFKEQLNEMMMGKPNNNFPLNDKRVFFINVIGIWFLITLFNILGYFSYIFPLIMVVVTIINGVTHLMASIVKRKYNPGLVISICMNLPYGIYTLIHILSNRSLEFAGIVLAFLFGILLHGSLFIYILIQKKKGMST